MPTLKEMVQQKRAKILMLVVVMVLAVYIRKVRTENVPDLVYFSSDTTAYCLSGYDSRNFGVAWIHPSNNTAQTESYYYPTIKNSYNTNFAKHPTKEWSLENWRLSDWSSLDIILDTRWESLKTTVSIAEFTHTSEASFHIKKFPLSFSVLASDAVEILLCEGWNPYEFSSYYIVIRSNEVLFKKVQRFNDGIKIEDLYRTFKADVSLLSRESWKSYHLSYDEVSGDLELECLIDNRYLTVVKVRNVLPLKPLYFLTRTKEGPAMWKIEDRRYLYTDVAGNTTLGPRLHTSSNKVCVSVYVALCDECTMQFYVYEDGNVRNVSKTIVASNEYQHVKWKEVRLLTTNKVQESIQLFVVTDFIGAHQENVTGFWALDEVRVCTRDEIKISTLKYADLNDRTVTCQSLNHPRWRPRREDFPRKPSFNTLGIKEVTATSATFRWQSEVPFMHTYMYNYRATNAKQCNTRYKDKLRSKSNGYVMTPSYEVHFPDLVPYTFYDIKITEPIYNSSKVISLLTSETDVPTKDELPRNVLVKPGNVSALITWDKLNCTERFGRLVFRLVVINRSVPLPNTYSGTENQYTVLGLMPNTAYTLQVVTSRSEDYIEYRKNLTVITEYNFSTNPGIAPKVSELEVYSSSVDTLDLHFKIPSMLTGDPTEVRTNYCLYGFKCNSTLTRLSKCLIAEGYYCIHLGQLLPHKEYHVSVSLRNNGTDYFGEAVMVKRTTKVTGPAAPTDLTYKMVSCGLEDTCHLLLTWKHPIFEKSPIDFFEIVLQEKTSIDDSVVIKEMHKVEKYMLTYTHQIRYIPFSTTYNISVRSVNYHRIGDAVSVMATTDDLGLHIDQQPKILNITTNEISFAVPVLDKRLESFVLTAVVQENEAPGEPDEDIFNVTEGAPCSTKGPAWIAAIIEVADDGIYNVTLGNGEKSYSVELNKSFCNRRLKAGTSYCVLFVVRNRHYNKEHVVLYYNRDVVTESAPSELVKLGGVSKTLVFFLTISLVFLFVGATWLGYRYWNQRKFRMRQRNLGEPIYMSLESLPQAVSNDTYDVLIPN